MSARPAVQNTIWPPSCSRNTSIPLTTRPMSAVTMTGLAPSRSSSAPTAIVEMPATMFAAIAKMITSPAENPKTDAASTPPNVKTPGETVAEHRAREQEPHRVALLVPEPLDVAAQPRVRREEADLAAVDRGRVAVLGHREQHGQREQPEPDRRDDHRDAHVEAVVAGDAEQADLGLDEAEVHDEQQHDAADVAHAPAEARHAADRARRRHLRRASRCS